MIERHLALLDDRLLDIVEYINTNIITYHRLPIKVFETLRTEERQQELFDKGFSKTLQSRHLPNKLGKSEAVDFVVFYSGRWSWDDKDLYIYEFFGQLVKRKFGNILRWGADFKTFKDYPHFELIDRSRSR